MLRGLHLGAPPPTHRPRAGPGPLTTAPRPRVKVQHPPSRRVRRAAAPRAAAAAAAAARQPPLSAFERREKRAESQRLAAAGALVTLQLGNRGVTPAFLQQLGGALANNGLVKVRVLGGDDPAEAAASLGAALDAVLVHKIGSTLTLYRQKGLPPAAAGAAAGAPAAARSPRSGDAAPPLPAAVSVAAAEEEDADADADEDTAAGEAPLLDEEDDFSDDEGSEDDEVGRQARARAAREAPPEFEIIG